MKIQTVFVQVREFTQTSNALKNNICLFMLQIPFWYFNFSFWEKKKFHDSMCMCALLLQETASAA